MMPEEKAELAELLEEKMFRCEPALKFAVEEKIINGADREIFVVNLKLRSPHAGG